MKKYIGTKIVHGEPMTAFEFNKQIRPMVYSGEINDGYLVTYEDGYKSWAPKVVFENSYRKADGLTFGLALESAKKGKGFRLPSWQPDVVIRAQYPDEHSKMTAPYLYVESRFGRVPWKETMIELFSDKWMVVD